jgi:hypothetical protein
MSDEERFNNSGTYVSGGVHGTGIAIGAGASARVQMTSTDLAQVGALLDQLKSAIQASAIPEPAKKVILNQAVNEMAAGLQSQEPKGGLEKGLTKLNMLVEASGAVEKEVSTIGSIAKKIAEYGGIAFSAAAPFLAKFFGL